MNVPEPSKTVLMIAPLFPPNMAAGAHRTLRFVKYLNEFGWKAVVVTKRLPTEKTAMQTLPSVDALLGMQHVEVIRVDDKSAPGSRIVAARTDNDDTNTGDRPWSSALRGNVVLETGKSLLRPLWQFIEQTPDMERGWSWMAAKAAVQRCHQGGINVVYSTGPPHSTHLAARHVAKKMDVPFVADFRDPWARNSWIHKRNPIGRHVLPLLEGMVVKSAAKVIANNDGSLASFQAAYPAFAKADRFVAITNGFDPEINVADHANARHNSAMITAVHAGSLYVQRDPQPIIAAISQLVKSGMNIEFHHIGTSDAEFDPIAIARELGCESSVRWLGQLSHADTLQRLANADLLVVIQPNAPFQIPGKVFEMLLFDQPILAVCESPPTEEVVRQAGGATAPSHDVDAIANAIRSAIGMRGTSELETRRREARALYNGRELTKSLASVLDEATRSR